MQGHIDHSTLEMALVGYEAELQKIMGAMASIRKQLGVRGTGAAVRVVGNGAKRRGQMSAAARKRIADAQRKRWAAFHAQTAKKAAPKRKMSPARKAALAANLAKARAARAAKKAAMV